jgi:hypothetical protein
MIEVFTRVKMGPKSGRKVVQELVEKSKLAE